MSKIDGNVGVPLKETNNYVQGKSGAETPKKMGPAVGKTSGNPAKGGGINRATQPGNAPRG